MIPATRVEAHDLNMSRRQYGAVMPDEFYNQLGRCETGGQNGNLTHSTRTYTGFAGINRSTAWRWSGHRDLSHLSRRAQIRVVDRIAFAGWERPGHPKVWPVGPFGWGAVRNGCADLLSYICHATHKRVQKYRARACRLGGLHG